MNKLVLLFLSLSLFVSSCVTSSKFSKIVEEKLAKTKTENLESNEWLAIKTDLVTPKSNAYNQTSNSFIPAIVYWSWNTKIECELSMTTRVEFLKKGITKAADSLELKKYLNGKSLEINISDIPGKFVYEKKGNVIFLLIAYSMTETEAIYPYPITMKYEYKVKNQDNLEFEGFGNTSNKEKPTKNIFKSTKKFTWVFLEDYIKETERMGLELVSNMIEKLKESK